MIKRLWGIAQDPEDDRALPAGMLLIVGFGVTMLAFVFVLAWVAERSVWLSVAIFLACFYATGIRIIRHGQGQATVIEDPEADPVDPLNMPKFGGPQ